MTAEQRARDYINCNDWVVESREQMKLVSDADYEDDPTGIEYLEQAKSDGEAFVFHVWPLGEADEESEQ